MLPRFKNIPSQSSMSVNKFKGINITESYEPGEVTQCNNVISSSFPALSSREKRTVVSRCDGVINGVGSFDEVFYTYYMTSTNSLFLHFKGNDYDFTQISNSKDLTAKRRFTNLENCIVIVPDNVMFYTDSCTFETIDVNQVCKYADVKEKFNKETGGISSLDFNSRKELGFIYHNSIRPTSVQYVYSGSYMDYYFFAFDPAIKEGDVLTVKMSVDSDEAISGTHYNEYIQKMKNGFSVKVKSIEKTLHKTPLGFIEEPTNLVFDDNSIDLGGYGKVYFTDIIIERKMPQTTCITSFNNRVWAVCENKIYASKLGEADEWNDFSVDSYGTLPSSCFSAASGSEGVFTAIIPHGNYIYALKENHIHKIYGDTPDEFTISGMEAPGVAGNPDTACVCGVNLMYASHGGVCVLRDGYPKIVSKKIGDVIPVCAAAFNNKYYMICQKESCRVIYVYDSEYDLWTMESCSDDGDNLCSTGKNLYYSSGGKLICMSDSTGDEYEKNVNWNFRLRFDSSFFCPATSIRAIARVYLGKNASFTVRAVYDDDTRGAICGFCFDETVNGCTDLRLPIKRDLGFYLDFKGIGGFTLRNIKFNYYKSDME